MFLALLLTACAPDVYLNEKGPEAAEEEEEEQEESPDTGLEDKDSDGYAAAVDCDDAHATVNPDAEEVCDGIDNDCDDQVDEGAQGETWYADGDADGYGAGAGVLACEAPEGHVANALDCDDATASVSPDAAEACNGVDDDCDGATDGADTHLALSTVQVVMTVDYCWPIGGCGTTDWPLDPDGTWALSEYTGTWSWDACTGEIEMLGGNSRYSGTSSNRVDFSGEMYSGNSGEYGTWTGVLR